jgi:hypothetical protein
MKMGFNKKYINKDQIITQVKESGVKSLGDVFTLKTDSFFFEDNFSSMIFDLFVDKQYRKIECLIR